MSEKILWRPSGQSTTSLQHFVQFLNHKHSLKLVSYNDVQRYSVAHQQFWQDLLLFCAPIANLHQTDLGHISETLFPPSKYFPRLQLNYAENCLEVGSNQDPAVYTVQEDNFEPSICTRSELKSRVHYLGDTLTTLGVRKGDNVGGALSNGLFAVTLALATAAIGATYSSISSDMGPGAMISRFEQATPKVVFFHIATRYGRKSHDLTEKLLEVHAKVTGSRFIMVPDDRTSTKVLPQSDRLIALEQIRPKRSAHLHYERVDFDAPLFVMFSSGTTGPPKCIVHSHGGVLLQHRKEHLLNMDMKKGDIYWQYTSTTWMMWQYQLSALASGAAIVVFDGSPLLDVPGMLKFMDRYKITHFGTSPRWLLEVEKSKLKVKEIASLEAMRCVTSTGSVLSTVQFVDFYKSWPGHINLSSICGGTDLMSCFFLGNLDSPVVAGELQCLGLGMSVKAFDESGKDVGMGTAGDLVCDKPWPSQPVYFLADPDGKRYKSAYYSNYPGVWHQGDYIELRPSGGAIVLGRSDGVLNPSGVRFGSAEIYSVTSKNDDVLDALCVGQRRAEDLDEAVCLFIVPKKAPLSKNLIDSIKKEIRSELSPRHVPAYVYEVDAIPMTGSGKKSETVIKQIISGLPITAKAGLANPECLAQYEKFYNTAKAKL